MYFDFLQRKQITLSFVNDETNDVSACDRRLGVLMVDCLNCAG